MREYQVVFRSRGLESVSLGLNPGHSLHWLCDLEQVTSLNSTFFIRNMELVILVS